MTINNNAELRMHDLFRGVRREIAHNNSHDEPGQHSRLWESQVICDVLKNHKVILVYVYSSMVSDEPDGIFLLFMIQHHSEFSS